MGTQTATIISLKARQELKKHHPEDLDYENKISKLDKLELLEEMVSYQEERNSIGRLTLPLMVRGRILFRALETRSETEELRLLTSSYRRHLDHELAAHFQNKNS